MGACPNVGLMAQKAEEYGSHPTTFEAKDPGLPSAVCCRRRGARAFGSFCLTVHTRWGLLALADGQSIPKFEAQGVISKDPPIHIAELSLPGSSVPLVGTAQGLGKGVSLAW